jgi:hypothetical protein
VKADRADEWPGVPCTDPGWVFTTENETFEVRRTISRFSLSVVKTIKNGGAPLDDRERTLEMIKAARSVSALAKTIERDLVHEARAREVPLKEIRSALGMSESAFSNYLARNPLAEDRKEELAKESEALQFLEYSWSQEVPDDNEPPEGFLRYGVEQMVNAYTRFSDGLESWTAQQAKQAGTLIQAGQDSLKNCLESLFDPRVRLAIEAHSPQLALDGSRYAFDVENPWQLYAKCMVFRVSMAILAGVEALEASERFLSSEDPEDLQTMANMIAKATGHLGRAMQAYDRPETMMVWDGVVATLRKDAPWLLPSETLTKAQLESLRNRRAGLPDAEDDD